MIQFQWSLAETNQIAFVALIGFDFKILEIN